MKNKEYIKGIATGVALSLAVGAGGYLGYRSQYDGVLSESEHVGKLKYLEHLIEEEYLGEVDQEKLAEGLYTGLVYGLGDVYSRLLYSRGISAGKFVHYGRLCGNWYCDAEK